MIQNFGALSFGIIIGWFVYYINKNRKGEVSFSDITTLIGVIGGGTVLKLFDNQELFGWYGVGLSIGFFGYFLVLIVLVRKSPNFDADWFLDGRRKNPDTNNNIGYGTNENPPMFTEGKKENNPIQNFYINNSAIEPATSEQTYSQLAEHLGPIDLADRVANAKRLLAAGKVYPKGCSEFVCEVLDVPYDLANEIMGASPKLVGSKPPYTDLVPGDIAGWVEQAASGHVAVYIGEAGMQFIHVPGPGQKPKINGNGWWGSAPDGRPLYKSARY